MDEDEDGDEDERFEDDDAADDEEEEEEDEVALLEDDGRGGAHDEGIDEAAADNGNGTTDAAGAAVAGGRSLRRPCRVQPRLAPGAGADLTSLVPFPLPVTFVGASSANDPDPQADLTVARPCSTRALFWSLRQPFMAIRAA